MTHIVRAFAASAFPLTITILVAAGCAPLGPSGCPACQECQPCALPPKAGDAKYEAAALASIPGWPGANLAPGLAAFASACARLAPASALRGPCEAARRVPADDEPAARRYVEENFAAWLVAAGDGKTEGLITGYYEPVLAGSLARSGRFRYPVYGPPDDLIGVDLDSVNPELKGQRLRGRVQGNKLVPYWTRAEIEAGRVRPPVLAWVEDPVELFFLQIQGSGQIALASGERLRLGYADQNGHPYRSLGRTLIQRGELRFEQSSMQGIKAWAAANPGKLREALDSNPSYVFFRELPPSNEGPGQERGPLGTLGVPLTAGYSIAVDARMIPLGAPVFLASTMPLSMQPLERLMAAQDTGGAIRGAVRADLFWGTGSEAGALAGRMRQQGRLWI
ncbi:MAG: murein transglycosylase A, partial [Burkholderiales bacterium]